MKCCNICKVVKPLDAFGARPKYKDGLDYYCRECWNAQSQKWRDENPEKAKAHAKASREKNREKHSKDQRRRYSAFKSFVRSLRYKYNLTIEQWDEMMLNQGGMCAICDQDTTLVIDHDHTTGKVRQLLCNGCNIALGSLKDSPDLATKAAEYLKKHKTP